MALLSQRICLVGYFRLFSKPLSPVHQLCLTTLQAPQKTALLPTGKEQMISWPFLEVLIIFCLISA